MKDTKSERTYPLTYSIHPEDPPRTHAEIEARKNPDVGACDAIILCSMNYPMDGSFSLEIASLDGRAGPPAYAPVSSIDLFKVWSLLAKQLSEDPELEGDERAAMAKRAFEEVRQWILVGRQSQEGR